MFPSNIVKACVEQDKTKIVEVNGKLLGEKKVIFDVSNLTEEKINEMLKKNEIEVQINPGSSVKVYKKSIKEYKILKIGKGLVTTGKANFLGLIVFSIVVGKIAGSLGSEAVVFIQFISVFNKIVTRLVILVMW